MFISLNRESINLQMSYRTTPILILKKINGHVITPRWITSLV